MGAYERRTGTPVNIPFNLTGTATVTCSAGKKVLGGGYTVTGHDTSLDIVYASANRATADDTWSVTAATSSGSGLTVQLTAYSICM
jgi:hypothetical protein